MLDIVFLASLSTRPLCKSIICKISFSETNLGRDKNETKPKGNKGKNACNVLSMSGLLSFDGKGTYLSRERRRFFTIYPCTLMCFFYGRTTKDNASESPQKGGRWICSAWNTATEVQTSVAVQLLYGDDFHFPTFLPNSSSITFSFQAMLQTKRLMDMASMSE